MNSIFFLVLRRMRAPLIGLIVVYAVSMLGLTLIPGVDAEGRPAPPMSFFHAFYFVSYTATTIGFGEIPAAFSDAQRLWVTFCIYLTVVSWSFSIITLLALMQDKGFQNTLRSTRFARRVRRIDEPFLLICGCGETGSLIARTLDRVGRAFVVLEIDEVRVQELDLEDFKTGTPALAADARAPANLVLAGLRHQRCLGVVAVTNDEGANLAIAIAVRLLNPAVPVLARARSPLVAANMASFGTDHIINPFERFAEYLALAIAAPERFHLIEGLTGLPGTPLPASHRPPLGRWVVCGYGRFGQAVVRHLEATGIEVTVIDPDLDTPHPRLILGQGTESGTLQQAGILDATGIVAASDSDVNNLSMVITAKELNPVLFTALRQNQDANSMLFDAFPADLRMIPSRIVAQECLAILTTPLLAQFLAALRAQDEAWCARLSQRLTALCAGAVPLIWSVRLSADDAIAAHAELERGRGITLDKLLRDDNDRSVRLDALPLMLLRGGDVLLLPADDAALAAGDHLLLAGSMEARRDLDLILHNANELSYVLDGANHSHGWLWQRLAGKRA